MGSSKQGVLCYRNAPSYSVHARVRCLQAIHREHRPASIASIAQRRAAIQNCCRCPVQQNFWVDPPVVRGVNVRPDHTTGSKYSRRRTAVSVRKSRPQTRCHRSWSLILPKYSSCGHYTKEELAPTIFKRCLTSLIHRRQRVDEYSSRLAGCDQIAEHPGPSGRLPPIDTGFSPLKPQRVRRQRQPF
jgi:hypothetical protein